MARFDTIKATIDANIKSNGNQGITGQVMNSVLNGVLSSVDDSMTKEAQNVDTKLTELSEEVSKLSDEVESNGVLIEDLQNTKIDKEADDYYPQLSVGLADNLVGVDVVDSSFTFRKSGGGAIADGTARIEAIKGNSVVWNQKVKGFAFWNLQGGTIEGNEVVWSASNRTGALNAYSNTFAQHTTHKYLISADVKASSTNVGLGLYYTGSPLVHHSGSGQYERLAVITQGKGDGTDACYLTDVSTSMYGEIRAKNYRCRDLTQMFGAGNEPRTIEEFNARKPLGIDENAYNEGTIIDTTANSIVSRGFNQWDGEWEQGDISSATGENINSSSYWRTKNVIPVIPNEEYIIVSNKNRAFIRARFYDVNKVFLGIEDAHEKDVFENESFKVPSNAHYLRFAPDPNFTSHEGLIVHLANTSHIASQNESYISRVQSLSIVQRYFPQGMKSVGTAHDEIRYNKTTQKWEKVEAIGTRAYQEGDADNASYLTDGKVTCYPLAEPIVTELEDNFNLDYEVWNGGTEKIVSDVPTTPLKAEVVYGFNAYGKIKENAQKIKELEKNGGSGYDDTEIRQELTELSDEIKEVSERVETLEQGGQGGKEEVFVATYGTTTYAEIVAARNEGKVVICNHEELMFYLEFLNNTAAYFLAQYQTISYVANCKASNNVWTYKEYNNDHSLETLDNGNVKVTIANKSAEVATPQYVENLLGVIINGEY